MMNPSHRKRSLALALAALMTAGSLIPASAAPIDSGVTPTYDEAYYATLDYYGNLLEGSVVKSYALNGASQIRDYGVYDEVVNLTDSTPVKLSQSQADFQFSQAPGHFYFEGKTAQPFQNLPWSVTLRYSLNGVPVQAEELAGQKGVVEIAMDLVPNRSASAYARYNYTLEAAAMFNEDDILSLEAEGAQVQLVGNLRTVLFMALPGEEQHFTIRVGSDDFSFNGMTILMVPATLSQLEEIAKLSQRKDELEEDYRALSGSLDALLDSLNDIQDGLYASANGLDRLDTARGTISSGKGQLYDDAGVLREDLSGIADLLEPVEERVQLLSQTITSSKASLNELTDTAVSLKDQLDNMEKALENLEDGTGDIKQVIYGLADMENSLRRLQRALNNAKIPDLGSDGQIGQMIALHNAYETSSEQRFFEYLLTAQGDSSPSATAAQMSQLLAGYQQLIASGMGSSDAIQALVSQGAADPETITKVIGLDQLFQGKGAMTFEGFCTAVLNDSAQAGQIAQLWDIYEQVSGIQSEISSTLSAVTKPTATVIGELADLCEDIDDLTGLIDDAEDLSAALRQTSGKLSAILDSVDSLRNILNDYEPTLQEGLTNMGALSTAAVTTLRDMETLLADTESLMRTSGTQLDEGTRQTLRGLAATLRQTGKALSTTQNVKTSKNALADIIEDTWHEYTGDINNLLLMDAEAQAVSLTDPRNPTPSSVQVLIRTQEIKAEDEKESGQTAELLSARTTTADNGTFWSRVAQMFKDLWLFLTGIFR